MCKNPEKIIGVKSVGRCTKIKGKTTVSMSKGKTRSGETTFLYVSKGRRVLVTPGEFSADWRTCM